MKYKLLWALALLLLVCGIALYLTARYADRLVDPYVRSLLEQKKPMNHRIDYRRIRVNLISRLISIKDVRIYPDSSLVKGENIWIEMSVGLIKLTDFGIKDMLLNKSLRISDLIFLKPQVNLHLPLEVNAKTVDKVIADTAVMARSPLLTHISLDRIILSGGSFRLIRNDVILASSEDISLMAREINLVRNSKDEPIGYTYGELKFVLSNIALHSETGLYNMSLDKFSVNKLDSSIVLNGFRMKPKYDKKEFYTNLEFTTERFDVEINRIEIGRIGFKRLIDGKPLQISKIQIDGLIADIYKNKNLPFNLNKFPLFYNESFLKISMPLQIDTIDVINSSILYNELAEGRTDVGLIRLDEFSGQSYNLTNNPGADTIENVMKFNIQAMVMGEGSMNVELVMPLEGNLRRLECSGSVGAMQLSPLNAMLEPSINIKFNAGKVNRMTFSFTGDDNTSKGWMEFLYNDVDVVLLKKDPGKEWGFVSLLANKMTHSNNPPPGKTDYKSVEIGCERDKNKGMINFVWRTIQSGMIRTILPVSKYEINRRQKQDRKAK